MKYVLAIPFLSTPILAILPFFGQAPAVGGAVGDLPLSAGMGSYGALAVVLGCLVTGQLCTRAHVEAVKSENAYLREQLDHSVARGCAAVQGGV